MRIDPLDVASNTIASVPLRFALAWMVAGLGAFFPVYLGSGFEELEHIWWQLLFSPLFMLLCAMASEGWSFIAYPLLIVLVVRAILFLRDEGTVLDLVWLFILPFMICIRAIGSSWGIVAGVSIIPLVLLVFLTHFRAREVL